MGEAENQDADEAGLAVTAEEWQGYYSVLVGLDEPSVVKRHGRRAWSAFTLGLRHLVQAFTQAASGHPGMMLGLIERIFPSLETP